MARVFSNLSGLPELTSAALSQWEDKSWSEDTCSTLLSVFGIDETLSSNEIIFMCRRRGIYPTEVALYNDPHANRDFWKMTFGSLDECKTAYNCFNSRDTPASQTAEYFTYNKCVKIKCLTVGGKTSPKKLAGAIAHALRCNFRVNVYAGGEECVYTACKSALIARDYLRDHDYLKHGELLNTEKIDLWMTVHKSNGIGGIKFVIHKSIGVKIKLTDIDKNDWFRVAGSSDLNKLSGTIVKNLYANDDILLLASMGSRATLQKIRALIAVSEEINRIDGSIVLIRSDYVHMKHAKKKNAIVTEVYRFAMDNIRIQAGIAPCSTLKSSHETRFHIEDVK